MRNYLYILMIVLFTAFTASAQEFRYGVLGGTNAYDIEVDGPLIASSGISKLNLGVFGDYQIDDRFGVKMNVIYTSTTEGDYGVLSGATLYPMFEEAKLTTLQFHPMAKFDVNSDYNKGFHLLAGFRVTNILSAEIDNVNASGFYKTTNFGALAGFGVTIVRTVTFEILADYSLGSHLSSPGSSSKNVGAYGNFLIDISSLIKK